MADASARVLILGSMPSEASLRAGQYYGHPRNAFWPLMGELLGFDATAPYAQRCRALRAGGVALWDVLRACVRPGSLDSAIDPTSERPHDFARFFTAHPRIHTVFLNGRKAEQVWRRRIPEAERFPGRVLPSSSPAMAALDFAGKLRRWRAVVDALEAGPGLGVGNSGGGQR